MRISVAEISEEAGLHKTAPVQVTLDPVEFSGQSFGFDQPFTGQADIWNSGDELLVRVQVSGKTQVACSRCLTTFDLPMKVAFEEIFRRGPHPNAKEDDEADLANEQTVTFYDGDEIDLADPLRENVLLDLPMKPLCSQTCQGLCPTCGTNLNEGACKCAPTTQTDLRLAKLKELLDRPDSNS